MNAMSQREKENREFVWGWGLSPEEGHSGGGVRSPACSLSQGKLLLSDPQILAWLPFCFIAQSIFLVLIPSL